MSWERYHFFMLHSEALTEFTLDDINPKKWFCSRSDLFGYFLETLFSHCDDFRDLHFLQWRDDLSWEQCNTTANVFNPNQQLHIIQEIQRFFDYLCQNINVLYKYRFCYAEQFENEKTLYNWIEDAVQYMQHHEDPDVENFFYFSGSHVARGMPKLHQIISRWARKLHNNIGL